MPSGPSIPLIYTVTGARLPKAPAGAERGRSDPAPTRPSAEDRLRQEVGAALMHDCDASDIEVHVSGARVTLRGQVADRAAKRQAEDCAAGVPGVEDVQNDLTIRTAVDEHPGRATRVSESG